MSSIKNTSLDITPDYSLSTEEVYKDFFLRYTAKRKSLALLRYCEMRESPSTPSWLPDLSRVKIARYVPFSNADGWSKHEKVLLDGHGSFRIRGVHSGIIAMVSSACVQAATTPELIASCRAWVPPDLSSKSYIGGENMFNAYIETLIANNINTVIPLAAVKCPSIEECTEFFHVCIQNGKTEGLSTGAVYYTDLLHMALPGRAFFTTSEGNIGLCPAKARTGDHICVILGCDAPLVLRQVPDSDGRYHVVGECYVHGLMFGEALLGPPPNPWQPRFAMDNHSPRTE
jgi:hypothetical protein